MWGFVFPHVGESVGMWTGRKKMCGLNNAPHASVGSIRNESKAENEPGCSKRIIILKGESQRKPSDQLCTRTAMALRRGDLLH